MTTRATIDGFLSHRTLALVRYSRTTPVQGVPMDAELTTKGYTVSVVYLEEPDPAQSIAALGSKVEGAIVAVGSKHAAQAVEQLIAAKIPRVWLQQGSESPEAIAACTKRGIPVVCGECVLMFAQPVTSFHAFHRWVWKLLGKLPA